MRDSNTRATYVGQVERDPQGSLWAVLYWREQVITRRQVRSLRRGKKCVSDLVLSAADNYPSGPLPVSAPGAQLLMDQRVLSHQLPQAGLATVS